MLSAIQKLISITSLFSICFAPNQIVKAQNGYYNPYGFKGEGTIENPFIIDTADELVRIKIAVNQYFETFDGAYFMQTENIDLSGIIWDGIGDVYDTRFIFRGNYNGDGHYISNITSKDDGRCNALFSLFGGKCYNLGIESGILYGNAIGSFVSHSLGDGKGMLVNCYNKATVYGNRSGGLADNFSGSYIYNCVNLGEVYGGIKGTLTTIGSCTVKNSGSYDSLFSDEFFGVSEKNFIINDEWSSRMIADKLNSTLEESCNMAKIDLSFMRYFDVNDEGELCFGELYNVDKPSLNTIGKDLYWISFLLSGLALFIIPTAIFFIDKKNNNSKN